jgi:two-component system phosphate regulon response regulator PhoB
LVYLVEGSTEAASRLRRLLGSCRHQMRVFSASADALVSAEKVKPSLFLINVQLETSSGMALCLRLRQHKSLSEVPIMLMSAQNSEDELIMGLELGADDFIRLPFLPRELIARINAVLRRPSQYCASNSVRSGPVEIDAERFTLSVKGRSVNATATQVRLVQYLIQNEGRISTRDQILDAVWSDTRFISPRTIDVHVRRIREMIEPDPAKPRYLKTVRGAGYYFASQESTPLKEPKRARYRQIPVPITAGVRFAHVAIKNRLRTAS